MIDNPPYMERTDSVGVEHDPCLETKEADQQTKKYLATIGQARCVDSAWEENSVLGESCGTCQGRYDTSQAIERITDVSAESDTQRCQTAAA